MTVSELVRMYARDGVGDALHEAIDSGLSLFSNDPGCQGVTLFRESSDPSCFILKVDWVTSQAHEAWAATDALVQWRGLLGDLRDGRTEPLGDYVPVIDRR